jgi:hypothetical protein
MMKIDIHEASLWYGDKLYILDKLDNAILGIAEVDSKPRVCYSREKVIQHFIDEGMSDFDATEFAEFNVFSLYLGDKTPLFIDDFFSYESDEK